MHINVTVCINVTVKNIYCNLPETSLCSAEVAMMTGSEEYSTVRQAFH